MTHIKKMMKRRPLPYVPARLQGPLGRGSVFGLYRWAVGADGRPGAVVSKAVSRTVELPGEFLPFQCCAACQNSGLCGSRAGGSRQHGQARRIADRDERAGDDGAGRRSAVESAGGRSGPLASRSPLTAAQSTYDRMNRRRKLPVRSRATNSSRRKSRWKRPKRSECPVCRQAARRNRR